MELHEVYAARDRIKNRVIPPVEAVQGAAAEGLPALRSAAAGLDVSLGVARGEGAEQFKLAVRLRGTGSEYEEFLRIVRDEVKSEADLDVVTTRRVRPIGGCSTGEDPNKAPLGIGASVGHVKGSGGTVGFFATRRSDKKLGLVSNNHVIALEDQARPNTSIIHPSNCDGGGKKIASLDGDFPPLQQRGTRLEVDCAFAVLGAKVDADLATLGENEELSEEPGVATSGIEVRKIGRTTRRTIGYISAADFDTLTVHEYSFGAADFVNQIEIRSIKETQPFCLDGDSGSLVYDVEGRAIGLLFASTLAENSNIALHYANPIEAVLEALQVDIAVRRADIAVRRA